MYQLLNMLNVISSTYTSMQAFFYQRILQNYYNNAQLGSYTINWNLLLPASQTITNLNAAQVSMQIQAYVDLCQQAVQYINTNLGTQTNLQIEQIQNSLVSSVSAINSFALQLLNAQNAQLIYYTTPYDMSLSIAMGVNSIDYSTYLNQVQLNAALPDMAFIPQGTKLILSKATING